VNSNPATIMTDPEMADATTSSRSPGKPGGENHRSRASDALLPTMGGQPRSLRARPDREGVLEKFAWKMIGAQAQGHRQGRGRELFKKAMESIGLGVGARCDRAHRSRSAAGAAP